MQILSVVLFFLSWLLSGCAADVVQLCLEEEQLGIFRFESQDECGCTHKPCSSETLCFHHVCWSKEFCKLGVCCNPALQPDCECNESLHQTDNQNCGCLGACPVGSHCVAGACTCNSALFSLCDPSEEQRWGVCQSPNECLCVASEHV